MGQPFYMFGSWILFKFKRHEYSKARRQPIKCVRMLQDISMPIVPSGGLGFQNVFYILYIVKMQKNIADKKFMKKNVVLSEIFYCYVPYITLL